MSRDTPPRTRVAGMEAMLRHVYYFTHLELPFPPARLTLAGDPEAWLPPPAEPAEGGWLVDLHATSAGVASPIAAQRALVELGDPHPGSETQWARTVTWRSANAGSLFPVLDGEVELAHVGSELSQLTLLGTYRPPLSVVGDIADRLVGHRIAEAVVRRFINEVAVRVTDVAARSNE